MLENVARVLNGKDAAAELERLAPGGEGANRQAAVVRAVAVVDAALGSPYPSVPPAAAEAFDELANGQQLEYASRKLFRRGYAIRLDHRTPIHLTSRSHEGIMAVWLAAYFMHPHRDRLRRCQQCSRWFVDMTRNKSALRCSRACTIAWSNAQRKEVRS